MDSNYASSFVAKMIFFTKGKGLHKDYLTSFELALRDVAISDLNLVCVASILPPECKIVTREEGRKRLLPGQIAFADDLKEGQGKPDPASFQTALQRMNLTPSEALVVENSPLGIEAANKAGIPYIVTLNNTPLEISDFGSLLEGDKLNNRIFKDTKASRNFLKDWCCNQRSTF
jgi:beta-phosphoglucomutase-like phosphatase (HAD superfamily)